MTKNPPSTVYECEDAVDRPGDSNAPVGAGAGRASAEVGGDAMPDGSRAISEGITNVEAAELLRGAGACAARPVTLRPSEAKGMGSPDPDAEVAKASERLRTGRLGYRFVKRAFDTVFSALVLILLCWLFLIVAIAIKIDDPKGPVFFGQERVGKDGRRFRMWKFRSMVTDAEERLAELQAKNEKTGPVFKMRDDPRVTRVGHFIRKTSIDELPQFLNVFFGDMSVVGPRPALPKEVATYTPRQEQRLLVKPGMTCYWQTRRNRDAITFDEWVELDLLYIKKCSAWADLKLIVQTIGVVLTAQGS